MLTGKKTPWHCRSVFRVCLHTYKRWGLLLLTWNLWSISQLICFLKSCHHKCSNCKACRKRYRDKEDNRLSSWCKSSQLPQQCQFTINTKSFSQRTKKAEKQNTWFVSIIHAFRNNSTELHARERLIKSRKKKKTSYLLSHEERQPSYSVFKQQGFLVLTIKTL